MEPNLNNIIKHLEMVQGVINRIAHNSFLLKGWAITLTAASFWLLAREEFSAGGKFGIMAVIFVFWGLDSYYLRQERIFRALYNHVRVQTNTDFSMTCPLSPNFSTWLQTCYDRPHTLLYFYGIIQVAIVIIL